MGEDTRKAQGHVTTAGPRQSGLCMLNSRLGALSSRNRNILPTQNTPSQAKNQRMQNTQEQSKLKPRGRCQEVASTWSSLAQKRQAGERLRRMGRGTLRGGEACLFILA